MLTKRTSRINTPHLTRLQSLCKTLCLGLVFMECYGFLEPHFCSLVHIFYIMMENNMLTNANPVF